MLKLFIFIFTTLTIYNCGDTVDPSIPVTSVSVHPPEVSLVAGNIDTVEATVEPSDATDKTLTWSSSDSLIATVDNGVITGESVGEVRIIVTSTVDDSKVDTVLVTVTTAPLIRNVSLSEPTSSIEVGSSEQLTVAVIIVGGASQTVRWSSSDQAIATVDSNGVITGESVGEVRIIVTSTVDDSKVDTVLVTVTTAPLIRSVSLSEPISSIEVGSSEQLTVAVIVVGGASQTLRWSSSDQAIATVDNGVITGISAGEVTIIATSTVDDSKADTVTLTVTVVAVNVVPSIRSVSLSEPTSSIEVGSSEQLTVVVIVVGGASQTVSWTSSDQAIATVDNGVITGISAGEVTIIATSTVDDSKADTVVVAVTVAPSIRSVSLSEPTSSIEVGSSEQLTVVVIVVGGASQTVSWTSSDQAIATVDNGVITGISAGEVTIIATSTVDDSKADTVTLTVTPSSVIGVSVDHSTVAIAVGNTDTFVAEVLPANASDKRVTWSSSDQAIATVSSTGIVTGVLVGTVDIIVTTTDGNFKDTVAVTVVVEVTGVTGEDSVTVGENATMTVVATVVPSDATDKTLTWSSSDSSIATVDLNGVITGVLVGTADIIVTTTDGNFKDTVIVTVIQISVTGVTLEDSVTVGENATARVLATVVPSNAADKSVSWVTSDDGIATVDLNGVITGVLVGTVDIIVTTTDGNFKDTVTVTVLETISTNSLTTITHTITNFYRPPNTDYDTYTKQSVAISDGDKTTVASASEAYQVHLGNITNATITHTFSKIYHRGVYTYYGRNREFQIAAMNGSTVKFMMDTTVIETILISNATTDITVVPSPLTVFNKVVTTFPNGWAAFFEIEILGIEAPPVTVTSVSVDNSEVSLVAGNIDTVEATVEPSDATDKTLIWSSSNSSIATVDSNGVITAVVAGTATITVTTVDGGYTADVVTVTVTAIVSVSSVSVDESTVSIVDGSTATVVAIVSPANATDNSVAWSSDEISVATVDQSGVITAVGVGTTDITVTTTDGSHTATVSVTVTPILVSSVTVSSTTVSLAEGNIDTVEATVEPSDATDKTLIWSSSDSSIVTVDSNGVITAVVVGTATITVTTVDGDYTADVVVTVTAAIRVSGIRIYNANPLSLLRTYQTSFVAALSPHNASNTAVTYSSSNEAIARVTANKKIYAGSEGTATITVTTVDGGYTATLEVIVTPL